jgi:tetratricopeptide (TPR) repeat protein
VIGLLCLLTACASPPKPQTFTLPDEPAPTLPEPAPLTNAVVAPPVAQPMMVPSLLQQQAQMLALEAADLLYTGQEQQALQVIRRAFQLEPGNRLGRSLLRQTQVDPVISLGPEAYAYTLQRGETLAHVAQRVLNDPYAFYLLARYNGIGVPAMVAEGQVIRVPGKPPVLPPSVVELPPPPVIAIPTPPPAVHHTPAPPPAPVPPQPPVAVPAPAPSPAAVALEVSRAMTMAQAAERAGQIDRAYEQYQRAALLGNEKAVAKADLLRQRSIEINTREARAALLRQDLDRSLQLWEQVLALDPDNQPARTERERIQSLKLKVSQKAASIKP